jgi:hypothetical protein
METGRDSSVVPVSTPTIACPMNWLHRLGLPVVHDECRLVELPGGAEVEDLAGGPPVEGERGVAQRAVRHDHWDTAHGVVHDLVPDEDLDGVGAGLGSQA